MPAPAAADLAKNWRRLYPPNFGLIRLVDLMVSLLRLKGVAITRERYSTAVSGFALKFATSQVCRSMTDEYTPQKLNVKTHAWPAH
jgi:hypothetical protein